MYARLMTVEAARERLDAGIATMSMRATQWVGELPGCPGAHWLADRSEGIIRAVIFFDSLGSLHASKEPTERLAVEIIGLVGGHVKTIEEYEVVAATGQEMSRTARFARSLAWQEDSTRVEQGIAHITEEVMPGVRQNAGFQGGFWLMDRASGRSFGCTLWDTAEHLRASGEVGRQMRSGPIQRGQMRVQDLNEYEIVAR